MDRFLPKYVDICTLNVLRATIQKAGYPKPFTADLPALNKNLNIRGKVGLVSINDPFALGALVSNKETLQKNFEVLVLGGLMPSHQPQAFRKLFPDSNIFRGECEESMKTVLDEAFQGTKGKTYFAKPVDIKNNYVVSEREPGYQLYSVELGRGCSYSCDFCAIPENFKKVRTRDADQVMAEIDKLPGRGVVFVDPNVSLYPEGYLYRIFSYMEKEKKYWIAEGSTKELLARPDLWDLMSRTCIGILTGIESFNQDGQPTQRKNGASLLPQKNGAVVLSSLIIGMPDQNPNQIYNTIRICRDKNLSVVPHMFAPYPGTASFNKAKEKNLIIARDFLQFNRFNTVLKTLAMEKETVQQLFKEFALNVHTFTGTINEARRIIKYSQNANLTIYRLATLISVRLRTYLIGFKKVKRETNETKPVIPLDLFD